MFSLITNAFLFIWGEVIGHRILGGLGNGVVVDVLGNAEGPLKFVDGRGGEVLRENGEGFSYFCRGSSVGCSYVSSGT